MKIHEPAMTFKNEKAKSDWEKGLANNEDPYGRACFRFASEWATLMEKRIIEIEGEMTISDIAQPCSREADTEGITGFMYGAAVAILSDCWVFGEDLRRWHNLDIQIKDEGERANERGTVLNPAMLRVGV